MDDNNPRWQHIPKGYTFNTLRFKEIDVAARELEVDLKFTSPDRRNVTFPISNADARKLVEALQSYLSEVREWRIRDLTEEIQKASDESIDLVFDMLRSEKEVIEVMSNDE